MHEEYSAGHMLTTVHHFFTELCFYYGCEWLISRCLSNRDNYTHAGTFCCDQTSGATILADESRINHLPKAFVDRDLVWYVRSKLTDCDLYQYAKFATASCRAQEPLHPLATAGKEHWPVSLSFVSAIRQTAPVGHDQPAPKRERCG